MAATASPSLPINRESRYYRLSEEARERHRDRNRDRKQRIRAERIAALERELLSAAESTAALPTIDELTAAALELSTGEAHEKLKRLKKQAKIEIEVRLLRYEQPFFGPETKKMSDKIISARAQRLNKLLLPRE